MTASTGRCRPARCGTTTAGAWTATRAEHPRFVQASGMDQLARLYAGLADGLVDRTLGAKVAELFARIAVYQTYEIVTDNLETGLFGLPAASPPTASPPTAGAPTASAPAPDSARQTVATARRQLVRTFNTAMTVRLRGAGQGAYILLGPEQRRAARVSTFDHTPAGAAHQWLATRFAAGTPGFTWDLWPAMVANIEAGLDVAATVRDTPLGGLVRDGMIERYRAVTRTLSDRHIAPAELAAIGAHTALVAPTLAYCVAVVADLADPLPGLAAVVDDGTLADALYGAAVMARLLNDVGSELLGLGRAARREALRSARNGSARNGSAR